MVHLYFNEIGTPPKLFPLKPFELPLTSRVYGTIHLIDTDIFDRVRDSVHGNFSDYKRTIGEVSAKGQLYIVNLVLHVGLRRIDHYARFLNR